MFTTFFWRNKKMKIALFNTCSYGMTFKNVHFPPSYFSKKKRMLIESVAYKDLYYQFLWKSVILLHCNRRCTRMPLRKKIINFDEIQQNLNTRYVFYMNFRFLMHKIVRAIYRLAVYGEDKQNDYFKRKRLWGTMCWVNFWINTNNLVHIKSN